MCSVFHEGAAVRVELLVYVCDGGSFARFGDDSYRSVLNSL